MPQPKFIYENLKDWTIAKQTAKARMEEKDISPFLRAEREKWFERLDAYKPTHQTDK